MKNGQDPLSGTNCEQSSALATERHETGQNNDETQLDACLLELHTIARKCVSHEAKQIAGIRETNGDNGFSQIKSKADWFLAEENLCERLEALAQETELNLEIAESADSE